MPIPEKVKEADLVMLKVECSELMKPFNDDNPIQIHKPMLDFWQPSEAKDHFLARLTNLLIKRQQEGFSLRNVS